MRAAGLLETPDDLSFETVGFPHGRDLLSGLKAATANAMRRVCREKCCDRSDVKQEEVLVGDLQCRHERRGAKFA
jgi:hypothetical protein